TLPLEKAGLAWIHPPAPLAHPFDDGTAVLLERSLDATCKHLKSDGAAYRKLMEPFVTHWNSLGADLLAPLHVPRHPIVMGRFALRAVRSAYHLSQELFKTKRARGLFAGLAAHSILPLDKRLTAGFGLTLGILGHAVGWPFPQGGSQKIADALAAIFYSFGGKIVTGMRIDQMDQLPHSQAVLCDIGPRQLLQLAGDSFTSSYRRKLEKYRYGPAAFKIDWALSSPIPWKAKECLQAGTVHLGGTLEEIAASEKLVWQGKHPQKPFVLIAQQSLFDLSRAPLGKHTAWGYCHVPNGSTKDMTEIIESQIERFAPGFRDCILARSTRSPLELEAYNANYVGGDINGGVQDIGQLFTRPNGWYKPYSTPRKGLYICSSSTPPGGGVHGMCGYYAAQAALKDCF
ncbi:MAG: NAD(P)/FAD-dependent oxidoreductase, partial [Parachlamydia sp.]|nr:NAD(P)/FAD-dependent oxidoreductase [Parachlamydia sp.]